MTVLRRVLSIVGLGLALAAAQPASAQTAPDGAGGGGGGEGLINAMVFQPVAPGSAITIRALDNSDQNIALLAEFEKALSGLGYRITQDSPLVLSFETRDVVGAWSDSGRRSIIELQGRGGRMGGEDARARLNLYDSSRGGLLNEGQGETNIVTRGRYRMDVTLDDRSNGKRLWQAWAESDLGQYHGQELLSAMVPVVAQAVGKTVRREAFKLP